MTASWEVMAILRPSCIEKSSSNKREAMCELWIAAAVCFISAPPVVAVEPPVSALQAVDWAALPDGVRTAADEFRFAAHWRDQSAAGMRLKDYGDDAVSALLTLVRTSADDKLQREAFNLLRRHFPGHPRLKEFVLNDGLRSTNFNIRYESLWQVGDHGWQDGHEQLVRQMSDQNAQSWHRFTAAKSLAELGNPRSLPVLLQAVKNDRYMPRHFGNIGLKALTGKNLTDFNYEYGEGAFVSGGVEATFLNPDPAHEADRLAKRYAALRDYLQWLEKARPDLYEHLTTRF